MGGDRASHSDRVNTCSYCSGINETINDINGKGHALFTKSTKFDVDETITVSEYILNVLPDNKAVCDAVDTSEQRRCSCGGPVRGSRLTVSERDMHRRSRRATLSANDDTLQLMGRRKSASASFRCRKPSTSVGSPRSANIKQITEGPVHSQLTGINIVTKLSGNCVQCMGKAAHCSDHIPFRFPSAAMQSSIFRDNLNNKSVEDTRSSQRSNGVLSHPSASTQSHTHYRVDRVCNPLYSVQHALSQAESSSVVFARTSDDGEGKSVGTSGNYRRYQQNRAPSECNEPHLYYYYDINPSCGSNCQFLDNSTEMYFNYLLVDHVTSLGINPTQAPSQQLPHMLHILPTSQRQRKS